MQNLILISVLCVLFQVNQVQAATGLNKTTETAKLPLDFNLVPVAGEKDKDKENEIHGSDLNLNSNDYELWEAPRSIQKNFPYYFSGHDEEEGRPIWVMEFGRMNLSPLVQEGGAMLKAFEKYTEQIAYRIIKSIKAANTEGRPVTEGIFILDFDELDILALSSFRVISFGLNLVIKNRELIMNYLGPTIFINTNFVAVNLIRLSKPALGRAFQKVEVFGTNKQTWLPHLRRLLGPSAIPPWYGGSENFKPVAVYGR